MAPSVRLGPALMTMVMAGVFALGCSDGLPLGEDATSVRVGGAPDEPQAATGNKTAKASKGLGLIDAEHYKIQVRGCKSGYTAEITEASQTVRLYKGDRGCAMEIVQFIRHGKEYLVDPARPFKTLAAGSYATFIADDFSALIVTIVSQLSDPLTTLDSFSLRFTEISKGDGFEMLSVVFGDEGSADRTKKVRGKTRQITEVTTEAPSFSVVRASLVNFNYKKSAANLSFDLECDTKIANGFCNADKLTDLAYGLFPDVDGTQEFCDETDMASCDRKWNAGVRRQLASAEIIQPGQEGLVNGGFFTKEKTNALQTPDNIQNAPKMLLVLRNAGMAYEFFGLELVTSQQLYLADVAAAGLASLNEN